MIYSRTAPHDQTIAHTYNIAISEGKTYNQSKNHATATATTRQTQRKPQDDGQKDEWHLDVWIWRPPGANSSSSASALPAGRQERRRRGGERNAASLPIFLPTFRRIPLSWPLLFLSSAGGERNHGRLASLTLSPPPTLSLSPSGFVSPWGSH